ncbi:tetratricopeptide repeat protein [Streptomyces sp. NBRC 109706]|uniref:ATP-binding protein n=1 Tax=Streptomyces sp. NBRC 109706 TaxID=1550035 RepID=UPI00131CD042|nr:tetratricopeptide repeat protein [Streptomyces sp. NBRC 109706]
MQTRDVHGGVHIHQHPATSSLVIPHQLPGSVRHFVNRSRELARLTTLLAGRDAEPHAARVAVITGTAGVGKTSLALHWAHIFRSHFPGGELYASLHGYAAPAPTPPEVVLGRFLEDLGVPTAQVPVAPERRESLFRSLLADRRMLIILDNAVDSTQVRPLLPGTSRSLALVTSRDDLTSLVTQQDAVRVRVATLPASDAVELLRVTTVDDRPGDRVADLRELALMCSGLPLALRIAAERAAGWPALPLGELVDELRDETARLSVLTADPEYGTQQEVDAVRSVFEWSYRALPEEAARLFRLLALHPGNEFGLPLAASLAGREPSRVRALLEILVRAHLLRRRPGGRYEFHDLTKAYAGERTRREESEGERSAVVERCAAWYLHTVDAAQRSIAPHDSWPMDDRVPAPNGTLHFAGYQDASQWYQAEATNLVDCTRAAADAGLPATAWRLAVAARAIHMHQNTFDAWRTTALVAVDAARTAGEEDGEAEALESLGKVAFQAMRLDEAEECHRAALAIRRRVGDRRGMAVSINALGLLGLRRRQLAEARAHFTEALGLFRELGDRRWSTLLRSNLAEALCELGRGEEAVALIEPALTDFRELGDHAGEGNALWLLSWAHREAGDPGRAASAIAEALALAEARDNQLWRGHWLAESSRVELARGNAAAALRQSRESAEVQRHLGDAAREAVALDGAGRACQVLGRYDDAVELHRRAVAGFRAVDARWQLAHALAHLADSLDGCGEGVAALAAREEAAGILGRAPDPDVG